MRFTDAPPSATLVTDLEIHDDYELDYSQHGKSIVVSEPVTAVGEPIP